MDYKKYYLDQAGGQYSVFRGIDQQRGYGLGGMFRSMFKYIIPLFKTHAVPVLKKGAQIVGTEAIKAATNIANDAIHGENVINSMRQHTSNAVNNLANEAQTKIQSGKGRKNKKSKKNQYKNSKKKKRSIEDIFS